MLAIKNLSVSYGHKVVLTVPKLNINKGEIIGIMGQSGSGKSTLVNSCLGLVAYKGKIAVNTHDIGVLMQEQHYVDTMTNQKVIEGLLNTRIKSDRKLFDLINFFDFNSQLSLHFKNLSGGQKQRMSLIMLLYQEPTLLFLDEMTTGLDFESRRALIKKLKVYFKEHQTTVIMVTHYAQEIEALADKLLIIHDGQVKAFDQPKKLFQQYIGYSAFIIDNDVTKTVKVQKLEDEYKTVHQLLDDSDDFSRTRSSIELVYTEIMKGNVHG
ncbi:ABC transporter ATP-binding protein [Leuconostoc litchii]|uniref:ABC transporter ATP-binding protein n=1 Tax=Leuconostoc litchii TaxID=1981069 RepID=A0A6P2CNQ5_9LACO|nr:ABC transporter ATP-binding protein [Leuconostoc litchii]TYC47496.1 ABC transporter ATP-binding protein [Leuconostoc litchii]GMA69521.1 ABC transporter ATP-binding protein [Leuconostoc litchii]